MTWSYLRHDKQNVYSANQSLVHIDTVQSPDTYILIMIEGIEHIIRKAGKKVDQEPRLHVVDSDDSGVTDHFPPRSNISGVEIKDNVNEEYHIDNGVNYKQTNIFRCFVL